MTVVPQSTRYNSSKFNHMKKLIASTFHKKTFSFFEFGMLIGITSNIYKYRCEIVNVHKSQFLYITMSYDASVIRSMLCAKHYNLFTPTYSSLFTNYQLNFMLKALFLLHSLSMLTLL